MSSEYAGHSAEGPARAPDTAADRRRKKLEAKAERADDARATRASTGSSPSGEPPVKVTRAEVVQAVLDLYDAPRYLEIGVSRGATFHALDAAEKVAVDPRFRFDAAQAAVEHPGSRYHAVASDTFFGEVVDPEDRFDVIYLDGLHTFEQTLRDFCNAHCYLSSGGVIVIDDVRPSSYLAAMPDIEEHRRLREALRVRSGAWMGDVYRLVFFIDSFFQQMTYRTVAENHGQLVAWRSRRPVMTERSVEEVARVQFERSVLDDGVFHLTPLDGIVAAIHADMGASGPTADSPRRDARPGL